MIYYFKFSIPVVNLIQIFNTTITNRNESIEIISSVGYNLLALTLSNETNEKALNDSFELINLFLETPDEIIFESQKTSQSSSS